MVNFIWENCYKAHENGCTCGNVLNFEVPHSDFIHHNKDVFPVNSTTFNYWVNMVTLGRDLRSKYTIPTITSWNRNVETELANDMLIWDRHGFILRVYSPNILTHFCFAVLQRGLHEAGYRSGFSYCFLSNNGSIKRWYLRWQICQQSHTPWFATRTFAEDQQLLRKCGVVSRALSNVHDLKKASHRDMF